MTDGDPGELWHEKIWNKPLYTEEEEMFEVVSEELQQASLKRRDDKDLQGAYDGAASAKQKCEDMIAAGIVILNTSIESEHDAYLDPIPEIDIVKALKVQCEWEMEKAMNRMSQLKEDEEDAADRADRADPPPGSAAARRLEEAYDAARDPLRASYRSFFPDDHIPDE